MVKKLTIIGLITLFSFALFSSAAFAKGKNHNNYHNNITYDTPDEGDNEHPSGKDRSIEHGKSTAQGKAKSDPDDDTRGPERSNNGPDKQPKGAGGVDKEDQDNNNGCGNDDDFEDDNEGWCGSEPKKDQDPDPKDDHDCKNKCDNDDGGEDEDDPDDPDDKIKDPEDPKDKPTSEKPAVKAPDGEVLAATTLPVTGILGNNYSLLILAMVFGGLSLYLISRRLEALIKVK